MQSAALPTPAGQLTKVLAGLRHTFVVADATLPDCPLVYASDGCAVCNEPCPGQSWHAAACKADSYDIVSVAGFLP